MLWETLAQGSDFRRIPGGKMCDDKNIASELMGFPQKKTWFQIMVLPLTTNFGQAT